MAVTADDLKQIYTSTRSDTELDTFLATAQLIVDEDLKPSCPMSSDRYDKITLYLAAHFLSISDTAGNGDNITGAIRRSKLGDADESYSAPPDEASGFNSTRWGQMALVLDKCGILANLNTTYKAQFRVV